MEMDNVLKLPIVQMKENLEKNNKIAADWSKDPLNNRDFRDPKVLDGKINGSW
jgi:hypothetical protein